jgi:hypothetical protein
VPRQQERAEQQPRALPVLEVEQSSVAPASSYAYANGHTSSAELALPAELAPVLTSPPAAAAAHRPVAGGRADEADSLPMSGPLPEEITNRVDTLLECYMGRVRRSAG